MTRPLRINSKIALGTLAGLSLLGSLAGCAASTPAADTGAGAGSDSGTSSDAPATAGGDATYTDGTYSAEGDYRSPGGAESIGVELTLEGDVVTAVTVTPNATSPNAVRYQGEFVDGIAAEVVGKDIDTLDVSRVAGSSLTSGGFNAAVETIKGEAAA